MELLSRDIKLIIHRYVFDYNYAKLKRQYRFSWLNGRSPRTAFWDDGMECFKYDGDVEVNWRYKYDRCPGSTIFRFRIFGKYCASSVLPNNY